jgi:tetratricopeptide (TPR) repeat protein
VAGHTWLFVRHNQFMRLFACCCVAAIMMTPQASFAAQAAKPGDVAPPASPLPTTPPTTDEDKANQLSEQVGKLMVKCVNLLTAQDPLSLDFCKQQRDLADQYPPHQRLVDKMLAYDEYGIALAAFDHKQEALEEFDREVALVPKAVKPGSPEWSTAYWHRAMIYSQMGQNDKADRDYRAAEENFRKPSNAVDSAAAQKKRRAILRQHAALLQKEGKTEAAAHLLQEAQK